MKKIILLVAIIFISCKEKTPKQESNTIKTTKKEVLVNDKYLIYNNSFLDFKPGDTIPVNSKNIIKDIQKNGEGDFKGYTLLNDAGEKIGFIFPKHDNSQIIQMIEISSSDYKTDKGISIGSTYEELKNKYPTIETHGSEIESRVSSRVGDLSFLLDEPTRTSIKCFKNFI